MITKLDEHGQPVIADLNYSRRMSRGLNELIGFMRGIMADGYISEAESDSLAQWVLGNRELADAWPVNVLVKRLEAIYADGKADEEERADLALLVGDIVGQQDKETFLFGATELPLTSPAPDVVFDRNEFVFTGRFLFGPRKSCQHQVELRGGHCADNVRLQTSYLVVGSLMSPDWKHSSFGNKIMKAAEYAQRCPLAIISEKQWESFLFGGARGD